MGLLTILISQRPVSLFPQDCFPNDAPIQVPSRKYQPSQSELKEFQRKIRSQLLIGIEQINEAINNSPTSAIHYYNRGYFYTSELQHSAAIKEYSQAIKLDPYFAMAFLNRAVEYFFLNDFNRAFSDCSRAIQLSPKTSEAYFTKAKIELFMGKIRDSIEDMKKAARLENSEAMNLLKKNNICWD